jgi:hypothetical protein
MVYQVEAGLLHQPPQYTLKRTLPQTIMNSDPAFGLLGIPWIESTCGVNPLYLEPFNRPLDQLGIHRLAELRMCEESYVMQFGQACRPIPSDTRLGTEQRRTSVSYQGDSHE